MFDTNFTFSHQHPRSPSLESTNTSSTRDASRSVSPCSSPTSPFPPPRYSVTDLAACLAGSRLRQDAQICYDPCDSYANMDSDDAAWAIPPPPTSSSPEAFAPTRSVTFPPRSSSSSTRRLQRQASTRLLACSARHQRDIAALVSKMVSSQTQCSAVVSSTEHDSDSDERHVDDDEGYTSSDQLSQGGASRRCSSVALAKSRLEYRRSLDLRTGGASVSKAVRFRRDGRKLNSIHSHRRVRSEEE